MWTSIGPPTPQMERGNFHPPPFSITLPQVNFSNAAAPEIHIDNTLPSQLTGVTYIIKKLLGSGAFGSAYRVLDNYGQPFVVKIAKPVQSLQKVHQDFEKEVKIMQSLNHPNIVRIFDAFVFQNRFCMVLEQCDGSMKKLLDERKAFTYKIFIFIFFHIFFYFCNYKTEKRNNECVDFAAQIFSGLHQIHNNKIIHRDVTKNNPSLFYS